MSRRSIIHAVVLLSLASPAAALARSSSGGASMTGGGEPATARPLAQPAPAQVSADGGGISFSTSATGLLHNRLTFTGTAEGLPAGTIIEIQRRGNQTSGRWADTAHGFTDGHGNFTAVWPANHQGRFAMRAVPRSVKARAAAASPSVTITVYRTAIATYYGPGSWGSRTACGQILRRGTLGVANRTLPCGTPVSILYRGRILVVPVIDRGPYANHADWDLTEATAQAVGMGGTATIGATPLPRR